MLRPPRASRRSPCEQWRYARYLSYCISAAVLLAVAFASAATLTNIFKPSSDTTTVFDTGGAAARDANPPAPSVLGPVPLLQPLSPPSGGLFIVATLVLTSVPSYVRRLTMRILAPSRTIYHVPRGGRAPGAGGSS